MRLEGVGQVVPRQFNLVVHFRRQRFINRCHASGALRAGVLLPAAEAHDRASAAASVARIHASGADVFRLPGTAGFAEALSGAIRASDTSSAVELEKRILAHISPFVTVGV
jgi:hypothetical protein